MGIRKVALTLTLIALVLALIAGLLAQAADAPIKLTESELWKGRALASKLDTSATLEQLLINQLTRVREDRARLQAEWTAHQEVVLKAHGGTAETHRIDWETGEVIANPAPAQGGK